MHLAQSKVSLEPFQRLIGSRDEVLVELRCSIPRETTLEISGVRKESSSFLLLFSSSLKEKKEELTTCTNNIHSR